MLKPKRNSEIFAFSVMNDDPIKKQIDQWKEDGIVTAMVRKYLKKGLELEEKESEKSKDG